MKKDYEWVREVISHKDNTMCHYPALRQLIKNFKNKWLRNGNEAKVIQKYEYHLLAILWYNASKQ